jgi:hypothetical protein
VTTHEGTALEVREETSVAIRSMEKVEYLMERQAAVQQAMSQAMKPNVHYGVIPGTEKPALLKPGAEMLSSLFRLRPEFRDDLTFDGDHLTVSSHCSLFHIESETCLAHDVAAMCSTHEARYAYRKGQRICPECGVAAIFKGKKESDGWYCWNKRGGCGSKFPVDDPQITSQSMGRTVNPDLPDIWNTIVKMAQKRALVAATLIATGASDMFTQDVDEQTEPSSSESIETPAPDQTTPGEKPKTEEGNPDPAAAIKLVQQIKRHPKYNQQTHGVPTRNDGVAKLQALLDLLEGKPADATPEPEGQSDPLDAVRISIRRHPRYSEEGGDEAYGTVVRDGDKESLDGLLAYLNEETAKAST